MKTKIAVAITIILLLACSFRVANTIDNRSREAERYLTVNMTKAMYSALILSYESYFPDDQKDEMSEALKKRFNINEFRIL